MKAPTSWPPVLTPPTAPVSDPPIVERAPVVGPVYMAGPITPTPGRTLEQNMDQAIATLIWLSRRRVAAICPQLTGTIPPEQVAYEDWMAIDFVLIGTCRAVLALPGWDVSQGTRRELAHAADCNIPVFFGLAPLMQHFGVASRITMPPRGQQAATPGPTTGAPRG